MCAGETAAGEAILVMHAAFAEYGEKGVPSSAMLETEQSLRD